MQTKKLKSLNNINSFTTLIYKNIYIYNKLLLISPYSPRKP